MPRRTVRDLLFLLGLMSAVAWLSSRGHQWEESWHDELVFTSGDQLVVLKVERDCYRFFYRGQRVAQGHLSRSADGLQFYDDSGRRWNHLTLLGIPGAAQALDGARDAGFVFEGRRWALPRLRQRRFEEPHLRPQFGAWDPSLLSICGLSLGMSQAEALRRCAGEPWRVCRKPHGEFVLLIDPGEVTVGLDSQGRVNYLWGDHLERGGVVILCPRSTEQDLELAFGRRCRPEGACKTFHRGPLTACFVSSGSNSGNNDFCWAVLER